MNVILAAPRGFCAGVDRAINIVNDALDAYGAPIYVRHEIVHNTHIVNDFKQRGVVFVDHIRDVPDGAVLIFSAHGVSKAVVAEAKARTTLLTIDATCPLVTKVHKSAQKFSKENAHLIMVGHKGHVEVEGTRGQVPAHQSTLVENSHDVAKLSFADDQPLAIVTQTTLSVDETADTIGALKEKFPHINTPKKQDICYATQNRQDAVKALAKACDVVLVVGSPTSSNSNRLREVALNAGAKKAFLIDGPSDLTDNMTHDAKTVGITAGASAPEHLVQAVVKALTPEQVTTLETITEKMSFNRPALPPRAS